MQKVTFYNSNELESHYSGWPYIAWMQILAGPTKGPVVSLRSCVRTLLDFFFLQFSSFLILFLRTHCTYANFSPRWCKMLFFFCQTLLSVPFFIDSTKQTGANYAFLWQAYSTNVYAWIISRSVLNGLTNWNWKSANVEKRKEKRTKSEKKWRVVLDFCTILYNF